MGSSDQEKGNSQTESFTNYSSGKPTEPRPQTTMYPTHAPPPMYYPNPHAYPQYANPYPPPGYHYHQPPPYYGPPPSYQSSSCLSRFCRSFISCLMLIFALLFLTSLLLALMLRPQFPEYKVVSLSVTNFTTEPTISGQWETKMVILNPNEKLATFFSDFKVDMGYKDGTVAVDREPGVVLNTKDHVDMDMKGFFEGNANILEKETMDDLVKERGAGSVTFNLKVSSLIVFKSGSLNTRNEEIVAMCDGLKVTFQDSNATTGAFDTKGKPVDCLIYI